MGSVNIDNTGSGADVTLSSDGTDLLLDGTAIGGGGGGFGSDLTLDDKTANYTIVAGDAGKVITHSANSITVSLTAAATLGAGFHVWIKNRGAANSVTTIDPDGSETVDGRGIVYLYTGESTHLYTDGTKWYTIDRTIMFSGNTATDYYAPPKTAGAGSIAAGIQATADGSDAAAYGYNASASGTNSLSLGYSTFATGTRSTAIGNARASGSYSLAAAIASSSASYGATGSYSVAIGYQNKATGPWAFAGGGNANIASQSMSIAMGNMCTASAERSVAIGSGSTASGYSSSAYGSNAVAAQRGKKSYASGRFAADGDAQGGQFILRASTTDATPTVLSTDNGISLSTAQIIAASDTCITFDGTITAMQNGAQAYASWKIEGLLVNDGGTTTLANSATTVIQNLSSWGMALSADSTNNALAITVTGEAAHNIRWVANIRTTEVTYA